MIATYALLIVSLSFPAHTAARARIFDAYVSQQARQGNIAAIKKALLDHLPQLTPNQRATLLPKYLPPTQPRRAVPRMSQHDELMLLLMDLELRLSNLEWDRF
jgi:hypothetical protein